MVLNKALASTQNHLLQLQARLLSVANLHEPSCALKYERDNVAT